MTLSFARQPRSAVQANFFTRSELGPETRMTAAARPLDITGSGQLRNWRKWLSATKDAFYMRLPFWLHHQSESEYQATSSPEIEANLISAA